MTFGKKISIGFGVCLVLFICIGAVSYKAITALTNNSYDVTHSRSVLEHTSAMLSALRDAETGQRGFVITGQDNYLEPYTPAASEFDKTAAELAALLADNAPQLRRLDEIRRRAEQKLAELRHVIDIRRAQGFEAAQKEIQSNLGKSIMDDIRHSTDEMEAEERAVLRRRADEVESAQQSSKATILLGTGICIIAVFFAGFLLISQLGTQIGSAVQHVQSSSTELQAAANQQASGAKESATAMNEITTTISELLATSRQIAESAQRVSQVAQETASASSAGDTTSQRAHESLTAIRKQVETIVNHMLDLGRKSQQIGGILELINELSEQTNILAINATIEAAGAGDAGKRFAVVADEIRKLADRVGGSTKEIRALIEEIRAAVNTTVMVTEGGAKAVELGGRQFGEVATQLQQIAGLISTTAQAAREIQLSTKQQASAVEQVNLAVANVAKASKETEASSNQTLQTATQLSTLSRELSRMVQPSTPGARA